MKCSICKGEINNPFSNDPDGDDLMAFSGHNAQPINDGRCCDDCNTLVIIERIKEMSNDNARSTR